MLNSISLCRVVLGGLKWISTRPCLQLLEALFPWSDLWTFCFRERFGFRSPLVGLFPITDPMEWTSRSNSYPLSKKCSWQWSAMCSTGYLGVCSIGGQFLSFPLCIAFLLIKSIAMENITCERICLLFPARGSLRWLKRKFFYLDGLEDVSQFLWDSVVV